MGRRNGVRRTRVWARLLGLQRAVFEGVKVGDEEEIVVAVRPSWRSARRGASVIAAVSVAGAARALTSAMVGGAGALWISAARRRFSKLRRRG